MTRKERRRHFFINKPLQLRYMLPISAALLLVSLVSLANLYFGIWGGVFEAFSDLKIQNDLVTAARMQEYEEARLPSVSSTESFSTLSLFRQAERLSQRQREVFKDILDRNNRSLIGKLIFLFVLIAWGSIFLSHKIAGPFYRFQTTFNRMRQGDLAVRCHLRKFDEAQPIAESLNQTLEFLDSTVSRLKNFAQEEGGDLSQRLSRLREELSNFKTSK